VASGTSCPCNDHTWLRRLPQLGEANSSYPPTVRSANSLHVISPFPSLMTQIAELPDRWCRPIATEEWEMQISLKDTLKTARLDFDTRLAKVLVGRPDLSYTEIEKEFGISETVIRRVMKQFNIGARKRGPKVTEVSRG
jgi:hypothetical protein